MDKQIYLTSEYEKYQKLFHNQYKNIKGYTFTRILNSKFTDNEKIPKQCLEFLNTQTIPTDEYEFRQQYFFRCYMGNRIKYQNCIIKFYFSEVDDYCYHIDYFHNRLTNNILTLLSEFDRVDIFTLNSGGLVE